MLEEEGDEEDFFEILDKDLETLRERRIERNERIYPGSYQFETPEDENPRAVIVRRAKEWFPCLRD